MLNLLTKPTGLNIPIQKLQEFLHAKLLSKWALADADYQCYGRCHRNRTQGGYVAEVYIGGNEYREVYWNDQLAALSFFGITDGMEAGVQNTTRVHLVFFVNLAKIKPAITHRADEEARADVQLLIEQFGYGFEIVDIDLWLENALREYQASIAGLRDLANENLRYVDMHPTHLFRINMNLFYESQNNC